MLKNSLFKSTFFLSITLIIVISLSLPAYAVSTVPSRVAAVSASTETTLPSTTAGTGAAAKPVGISGIPLINAEAAIVVDSERGQILFSKQHEKRLQSSVVNKIMTALVVMENAPLDVKITISKESSSTQDNTIVLETGVKYSVEDLLYALMLVSSSQSANVLVDYVSGSVPKFVEKMNKKASELGMKNTKFINTSGLYDEAQYTTAQDASILIIYALKNANFRNYFFGTKARPWLAESSYDILINQNTLFWMYDGVNGGTYGYFDPFFQSAVTSAQKGIQTLITIVLNSNEVNISNESVQLFDYSFSKFKRDLLISKGQGLKSLYIEGQTVELVNLENSYYTFPVGDDYIKSLEFIDKPIQLPIKKDYSLSTARYILKDGMIIDIPLYPNIEISAPANLKAVIIEKLTMYKDILILLLLLVLLELLIIIYNVSRTIKKYKDKGKYLKRKLSLRE